MVSRKSKLPTDQEKILESQIPEYHEDNNVQKEINSVSSVGKKLSIDVLHPNSIDTEGFKAFEEKAQTTKMGGNIFASAETREGWIPIDRRLLGERSKFYPENWVFMVRPATVEAIRNWSMIDETNGNSIDDVFNEILKYCLSIKSGNTSISWSNINSWDKFFFVLLIREYTFAKGESNIEFYEECPECESQVRFTLESQALMYDFPDDSVFDMFDCENRCWYINPRDYDVEAGSITLWLPSVDKDIAIKNWLINEYQENENKKFDQVFIKFLPWLLQKISKDNNIAKQQIRKAEITFKSWNADMFAFMDSVLKNIIVTPKIEISAICPKCGEEVTARLRFPNGISALFNVVNRHKKFGTK